ncbi:MAG: sensor histidine kinase [Candidatus Marinimicrobia bacterium]|nr:sensor histidine kinase [Candidatus Neomarinimicrobiota bacterium]
MGGTVNTSFPVKGLFEKRWVQHLLFWLAYMTLFSSFHMSRGISEGEGLTVALFELVHLSGLVMAVYLNLRILIPRYIDQKKYLQYTIMLLAATLLISIMINFIIEVFLPDPPLFKGARRHRINKGIEFFVFMYMMVQFFFVAVTSFLHYIKESARLNEIALRVKDLESSKLQTELDSLKAQINPHFLFNTLNNIYSHSLFKSEQTPEMILKLSGLMNYMIYECQDARVPLSKEIEFIKNFMALEKVRIDESVKISLNITIPENGHEVAPLLFIPLLENAFKYGVNIREGSPYINMDLSVSENDILEMVIENLFDEPIAGQEDVPGGIGLENVRKRLELIYPGKHEMEIVDKDGKFRVNLRIDLR